MKRITDALNQYAESVVGGQEKLLDKNSHFYDFRHNIFKGKMDDDFIKMFLNGDGNELAAKACAVHSSSMLGYNFFHWVKESPVTIRWTDKDVFCYDTVLFEIKMRVLKGRSNPANMDVVLTNANGDYLFIESKFLEYTKTNSFKIADAYQKEDRYWLEEDSINKRWSDYVASLVAKNKTNHLDTSKSGQYWDGVKQEITHIIALNNWLAPEKDNGIGDEKNILYKGGDIRFINLVFDPNKDYEENKPFKNYRDRYDELYKDLEEKRLIPSKLITSFMTYSQMWDLLKEQMNPELRDYLWEHYMRFSNASK